MDNRIREIAADATNCGNVIPGVLAASTVRPDTPTWLLTVKEFVELLESVLGNHAPVPVGVARSPPRMTHGLDGTLQGHGVRQVARHEYEEVGDPDEAIIKAGKKTIIYADKALDVLSNIINNEK